MTTDLIRYDLLVQDALRAVMRKVLGDVARGGLPGDHHFFITFRTRSPGVRLSNRTRESYPQEMTIVLQHQFWDLNVGEHAFEVGLSFHGQAEILVIPYTAVTGFFDPSVEFGLKFDTAGEAAGEGSVPPEAALSATRQPVLAHAPSAPHALGSEKTKARGSGSEPIEVGPSRPHGVSPAEPEKAQQNEADPTKVISIDTFRKKP